MYINYNDYGVKPVKWKCFVNTKPVWDSWRAEELAPNVSTWIVPGTIDPKD